MLWFFLAVIAFFAIWMAYGFIGCAVCALIKDREDLQWLYALIKYGGPFKNLIAIGLLVVCGWLFTGMVAMIKTSCYGDAFKFLIVILVIAAIAGIFLLVSYVGAKEKYDQYVAAIHAPIVNAGKVPNPAGLTPLQETVAPNEMYFVTNLGKAFLFIDDEWCEMETRDYAAILRGDKISIVDLAAREIAEGKK